MPAMTLSQMAARLNHADRLRRYAEDVKAAGLKANDPQSLAQAVLTRTSQSSAATFEGAPAGRNLPYGPGHAPQGAGVADVHLRAAGPWGRVGWLHDAKNKSGQLYGFFIRGFMSDWAVGFRRQMTAIVSRAPRAWTEARGAA